MTTKKPETLWDILISLRGFVLVMACLFLTAIFDYPMENVLLFVIVLELADIGNKVRGWC